jgi:hypothetical protein
MTSDTKTTMKQRDPFSPDWDPQARVPVRSPILNEIAGLYRAPTPDEAAAGWPAVLSSVGGEKLFYAMASTPVHVQLGFLSSLTTPEALNLALATASLPEWGDPRADAERERLLGSSELPWSLRQPLRDGLILWEGESKMVSVLNTGSYILTGEPLYGFPLHHFLLDDVPPSGWKPLQEAAWSGDWRLTSAEALTLLRRSLANHPHREQPVQYRREVPEAFAARDLSARLWEAQFGDSGAEEPPHFEAFVEAAKIRLRDWVIRADHHGPLGVKMSACRVCGNDRGSNAEVWWDPAQTESTCPDLARRSWLPVGSNLDLFTEEGASALRRYYLKMGIWLVEALVVQTRLREIGG